MTNFRIINGLLQDAANRKKLVDNFFMKYKIHNVVGKVEYTIKSPFRNEDNPSFSFNAEKCIGYDHASREKYSPADFFNIVHMPSNTEHAINIINSMYPVQYHKKKRNYNVSSNEKQSQNLVWEKLSRKHNDEPLEHYLQKKEICLKTLKQGYDYMFFKGHTYFPMRNIADFNQISAIKQISHKKDILINNQELIQKKTLAGGSTKSAIFITFHDINKLEKVRNIYVLEGIGGVMRMKMSLEDNTDSIAIGVDNVSSFNSTLNSIYNLHHKVPLLENITLLLDNDTTEHNDKKIEELSQLYNSIAVENIAKISLYYAIPPSTDEYKHIMDNKTIKYMDFDDIGRYKFQITKGNASANKAGLLQCINSLSQDISQQQDKAKSNIRVLGIVQDINKCNEKIKYLLEINAKNRTGRYLLTRKDIINSRVQIVTTGYVLQDTQKNTSRDNIIHELGSVFSDILDDYGVMTTKDKSMFIKEFTMQEEKMDFPEIAFYTDTLGIVKIREEYVYLYHGKIYDNLPVYSSDCLNIENISTGVYYREKEQRDLSTFLEFMDNYKNKFVVKYSLLPIFVDALRKLDMESEPLILVCHCKTNTGKTSAMKLVTGYSGVYGDIDIDCDDTTAKGLSKKSKLKNNCIICIDEADNEAFTTQIKSLIGAHTRGMATEGNVIKRVSNLKYCCAETCPLSASIFDCSKKKERLNAGKMGRALSIDATMDSNLFLHKNRLNQLILFVKEHAGSIGYTINNMLIEYRKIIEQTIEEIIELLDNYFGNHASKNMQAILNTPRIIRNIAYVYLSMSILKIDNIFTVQRLSSLSVSKESIEEHINTYHKNYLERVGEKILNDHSELTTKLETRDLADEKLLDCINIGLTLQEDIASRMNRYCRESIGKFIEIEIDKTGYIILYIRTRVGLEAALDKREDLHNRILDCHHRITTLLNQRFKMFQRKRYRNNTRVRKDFSREGKTVHIYDLQSIDSKELEQSNTSLRLCDNKTTNWYNFLDT